MSPPTFDPWLHRALLHARDKREQRGAAGDAMLVLRQLEPEEAFALDGLLSPRKPILPGRAMRIALSQFEAALHECGIDPRSAYEGVGGRPLRDLPAQRAADREIRVGFRAWLAAHAVARSRPAIAAWLDHAAAQGRVRADSQPLVEQALRIVDALPAPEPIQRVVLAARMLDGDPHGLDVETPLHGLTVSLLAAAAELDPGTTTREIWSTWNVLVDPISSNVAALNLPLLGEGASAQFAREMRGTHVVLTYGQLDASELRWPPGLECYSCENPSVLIAAEQALGGACRPLICTAGRPSDAVRLLLSSLHASGARIHHHGDYDSAGVQILHDLEDRYGARPWHFGVTSLGQALGDLGRAVPDPPPVTLEDAVRQLSVGVAEELEIDKLLADLAPG
ncbi:MAG: TIGR02679 domain-containing protein [Solirubrobacteraceae bacterium]